MAQNTKKTNAELLNANNKLREKLSEYEQLIEAIRNGDVDAVLRTEGNQQQLIAFEQTENIYRQLIEKMGEGALVISDDNTILYANQYIADMLQVPLEKIIGSELQNWIAPDQAEPATAAIQQLLNNPDHRSHRGEYSLQDHAGITVPVYISMTHNGEKYNTINAIVTDLREQKRNEQIAANEKLARAILEQTSDAIIVCDPSGIVIRSSASARRLCNKNPVNSQFEKYFTLFTDDNEPQSLTDILAFDGHGTIELQFSSQHIQRIFQVTARRLYSAENNQFLIGSVITLADITDIKNAEKEAVAAQKNLQEQLDIAKHARKALLNVVEDIKESEDRLNKIASRLPGMVYQYKVNPDGKHSIPYASDAITEIFQLTAKDVKFDLSDLFKKIHPDDLAPLQESILISARDLRPWQKEFRVIREDKTQRWLLANANPERENDGSVLWHGFVTDVTETKSIREKAKQAAQVFKQSREGIMITDTKNNILMVNKAFTEITGYSEQETLGNKPSMLKSGTHNDSFYMEIFNTIEKQGFWEGEIWNQRKDGTLYPEWLSITQSLDERGHITGYIGIFDDISQRKEYEKHIQWLAHYDPLTKLPNRVLFRDRVENALRLSTRHNKNVSILFCDLDHFKNINDALGHNIGDLLLIEISKRLSSATRQEDTISRQGGDEFVILLPETDADGAAFVADKIQSLIRKPYYIESYEMTITVSIGITVYPDDGNDYDTLLKNSDIAMYRAKQLGRNSYFFYSNELQRVTSRTLKLEKDIHNAIDNNELQVYFQPQVSLITGKITGVEALLRWFHPELGVISPVEFIPIAENSGQILKIGEWVTRTSVLKMKDWLASGISPITLSVNLSVRELRQPLLIEKLTTILAESGLDPGLLELEITESMLMEEQETVINTLNQINEMGIHLSIDDFGTGYSSLSYLKQLPVDQLKIDKAFVQDMLDNIDNAIIARSIITLGHSLGLTVIAEGVETSAHLDFLRTYNCDSIQGYLFSKPLPADQIEEMLLRDERMPLVMDSDGVPQSNTLLVVDDEKNIINSIKRSLRRDGYNILHAENGKQGLELLAKHNINVILSDQRMPGMSGVEFLHKAKELYPETIRMVLSGYTDINSITDAINKGDIYKFLTKPWDDELLRANIREAFQRYQDSRENQRLIRELRKAQKDLARLSKKTPGP